MVVRDVAELLLALDDQHRTTIVLDAADSPVEMGFFARLSRDFPTNVAVIVQGEPAVDRRVFHDQGVYRAVFDPADGGLIPEDGMAIDRETIGSRAIARLQRSPTPLTALRGR